MCISSFHAEKVLKKPAVVEENISVPITEDSACSKVMKHAAVRHKEITSLRRSFSQTTRRIVPNRHGVVECGDYVN